MRVTREIVKTYDGLFVKITVEDIIPHEQTLLLDKFYDYFGNLLHDYHKGQSLVVYIKVAGNGVDNVVKKIDEIEDLFFKVMTDFEYEQKNAFNILTLALGYLRTSNYALESYKLLGKLLNEKLKESGNS